MLDPWGKKAYDQSRHHIKKQRHYFSNKGPSSQSYGFSVVMYGCESERENENRSAVYDSLRPVVYTVHGILQARILEWVAVPFSRGSTQPRD